MDDGPVPLLPHQEVSAAWLAQRRQAFLADQMRVGKTPAVIRACDLIQAERILVLCPSIARTNWGREFARFSPRERNVCVWLTSTPSSDWRTISIVSYDLAIRNSVNSKLASQTWDVVVLDEAHYLKEPTTQRTRAAYALAKGARCWRLSGTPAPNHYGEWYTHVKTAGLWTGSYEAFLDQFCHWYRDEYNQIRVTGSQRAEQLSRLLAPFTLRRLLEDVVSTLPPVEFIPVAVEARPVDINRWWPMVGLKIESWSYYEQKILEQCAAVDAMLKVAQAGDDFTHALGALQGPKSIDSRRYVGLSKTPAIAEMVAEELERGDYEKIVIFAWHKDVIHDLRERLAKFHPVSVFGGTPPLKRDRLAHEFRTKGRCRVFIGQILAAGVAIDLSVASEVLFAEMSWVPGDNAQAAMRVHHLKQTKPVRVRVCSTAETLDERVNHVLRRKTRDLTVLDLPATPPTVEGTQEASVWE